MYMYYVVQLLLVLHHHSAEKHAFEACANGVLLASTTVAALLMNHIAFLSMLAWFNATIAWLTGRVGYPDTTFGVSCTILALILICILPSLMC